MYSEVQVKLESARAFAVAAVQFYLNLTVYFFELSVACEILFCWKQEKSHFYNTHGKMWHTVSDKKSLIAKSIRDKRPVFSVLKLLLAFVSWTL